MAAIGDADFAANLAAGVTAAAVTTTVDPPDVDDEMEELLSFARRQLSIGGGSAGGIPAGGLMDAPVATQQELVDLGDDDDDRTALDALTEKYPTLTAKTFRMRELLAEKLKLDEAGDPFELITSMHDTVEGMPDGEDKLQSTQMFNAVAAVFESARKNEGLRVFSAELFSALKSYYETKEHKMAVTTEYNQLNKLYNEQEYEKMMADFDRKKAERASMLERKVAAKAAAVAAKAAAKASASGGSSSKKQKM